MFDLWQTVTESQQNRLLPEASAETHAGTGLYLVTGKDCTIRKDASATERQRETELERERQAYIRQPETAEELALSDLSLEMIASMQDLWEIRRDGTDIRLDV